MSLSKRMSFIALILLTLLCLNFAYAATIVVVNETEESFYTIDNIDVSGDLEQNYINIRGSGEIISDSARVYLFGLPSEMNIENLQVNGPQCKHYLSSYLIMFCYIM